MLEIRNCKICNKQFQAVQHNHNCCSSECAKELTRVNSREYKRRKRGRNKSAKPKTLHELSVEAAAHGMSYGMYVAQLELKGRSGSIARE